MSNHLFGCVCVCLASMALSAQTNVGGPILADTTWSVAGNPYTLTSSVSIAGGATLTVGPGVEIRLGAAHEISVGVPGLGQGTLVARGTAGSPIRFTSVTAVPGTWNSIRFTDLAVDAVADASGNYVSGSILEHCVFEYGGRLNARAVVEAQTGTPYLSRCVIRSSMQRGVEISSPRSALFVTGCRVEAAAWFGIAVYGGTSVVIRDNVVQDCASIGINVSGTSGNYVISRNTVYACGSSGYLFYVGNNPVVTSEHNLALFNGGYGFQWHQWASGSPKLTMTNCVAANNAGTGMHFTKGNITVDSCTSANNRAGGIYCFDTSGSIRRTLINSNTGASFGGLGATNVTQPLLVQGCVIAANKAQDGGGLSVDASPGVGVAGDPINGVFNLFLGNTAARGDDIFYNVAAGKNLDASYVLFAGPHLWNHPNQVWDYFDNATLGQVTTTIQVRGDPWARLGGGLKGVTGEPVLTGIGALSPASVATLAIANASPSSSGALVLGAAKGWQPVFGGLLVPEVVAVPATAIGLITDSVGNASLTIPNVPPLPSGAELWSQFLVFDATGPQGIVFSNGLLGVIR